MPTTSRCHSRSWRSHAIFSSNWPLLELNSFFALCSLYDQWAATPYSANSCISCVRTCTSSGMPPSHITVVWRDWYRFSLGVAM